MLDNIVLVYNGYSVSSSRSLAHVCWVHLFPDLFPDSLHFRYLTQRAKQELKSILQDDKCRDGKKGAFVRSLLIQALQVQAHLRNGLSEDAILNAVVAAGDNSPPLRAALNAIKATCCDDIIRSIIKEPSMMAFFD